MGDGEKGIQGMGDDIRWVQRFKHFQLALAQLQDAQSLAERRPLTRLEAQGMIQSFEYTFELAWKVLKDFLESRGVRDLYGSRDVIRAAFQRDLLDNGQIWMAMIESRNLTSHTYDDAIADRVLTAVRQQYVRLFDALDARMRSFLVEGQE